MGKVVHGMISLLAALLFFVSSPMIYAGEVETEPKGIQRKIEKERRGITKTLKREGSVVHDLEKIEKELDRKNRRLKRINSKLEPILVDLQRREQEAKKINSSLRMRKELLKRRARALYKWQRGGSPFILLNGGFSVVELMQRKRYLELMLAYDQGLVGRLRMESARQQALKGELARKREEVDGQRGRLVKVKKSIRLERKKKRKILSGLRRQKEAQVRALKELERAAQRLQKMMDEFSRKLVVRSKGLRPEIGFERMRGRLDYPVRGEVRRRFGKTRHPKFSAELFRKGIDIEAPLGEEIKAVEGGKVVFADRLLGYGKMMIVDHGQRYYTIYAHLSDLLKKTGESVRRGEPIALVGDSDSLTGARLYFEIRKGGKPLDPLPWFKER